MNINIPGWDDLLKEIKYGEDFNDVKAAEDYITACTNVSDMLFLGLRMTGSLLWKASQNKEWPVDAEEAGGVGAMVECLTDLLQQLKSSENNATYALCNLRHGLDYLGRPKTAAAKDEAA